MRITALVPLLILLPLATYAASRDLAPAERAEMVSERRVALVIGNGAYTSSPLKNPTSDAKAMASSLRALGFEVMHHEDIDQKEMQRAIRDFGEKLETGGVGLFYYAGHGMQVDGRNYLIPVRSDALIQKESDVELESVDLGRVLGTMKGAKNRLNIVILDACRNNPFARSFRSGSRGLAEVQAPVGTFIAYATAAGSVAADGEGANGAYTEALLRHIQTPGEQLEMVFKAVRTDVYQASGGAQVPWDNNSILGEFYFMLPPEDGGVSPHRPDQTSEDEIRLAELRAEAPAAWSKLANLRQLGGSDAKRYVEDFVARYRGSGAPELAEARVWLNAYVEVTETTPPPRRPSSGDLSGSVIDAHGYKMVSLPGGSFEMGCTPGAGECDHFFAEKPVHRVTISGFSMGATEVTQGVYRSVMGTNPSKLSSCGDDCPVEQVSWFDAVKFANALSRQEGLEECYSISGESVSWPKRLSCTGYRLPTEAEWEYAARAGEDTLYAGGDKLRKLAWYAGNSSGKTHAVGSKQENAWGLYDMTGNVEEWCWDWYDEYQSGSSVDPVGAQSGSDRVLRGGGWSGTPRLVRVAYRGRDAPSYRVYYVGLRLSRSIP